MYCSLSDVGSERKIHIFPDMSSAYAAGCRVARDWLLFEGKAVTEDGDSYVVPEPRRPKAPKSPTRFARVETQLKDGTIHASEIPVFHFTETRPSPRTHPRTICMAKLYKLYRGDYHRHIEWGFNEKKDRWQWFEAQYDPNVVNTHSPYFERADRNPFGFSEFKVHVKGRETYGNFASDKTGYCVFDSDFHEPIWDVRPCLDVIRIIWKHLPDLMDKLGGYGLHAQIKIADVDGIHGFFFLRQRLESDYVERTVKEFGLRLEAEFPELLEARRSCCNPKSSRQRKSIHFIDKVGPNNHNGFRLPFCKGRQMIADEPIPVEDGKHDIVKFITWQEECLREQWTTQNSMSVENLVGLVASRFKGLVEKDTVVLDGEEKREKEKREKKERVYSSISPISTLSLPNAGNPEENAGFDSPKREAKLTWKGNARRIIVETFTGQLVVPKSLDEISCFLARIAADFNESADEATERYEEMLRLIPAETASELSLRLANDDDKSVIRAFRNKLKRAESGSLRLRDSALSSRLLGKCTSWWKKIGFNPFAPKTWNKGHPLHRKYIRDIWTPDDKMDFCSEILPILGPSKNWVDPVHLVNVCLYWVRRKEREENGMALPYWKAMLEGELNVPCGNKGIRRHQQIKNALIKLGVIVQTVGPTFGKGNGLGTRYAPGPRAQARGNFLTLEEMEGKALSGMRCVAV